MVTSREFGSLDNGQAVTAYTLSNRNGMSIEVLSYGCTLRSVLLPGENGELDVCLGYDTVQEYIENGTFLGAVCGRYANRIAKGQFTLNGVTYQLPLNNFPNHLHGGDHGFFSKVFETESIGDQSITFFLLSPDGDEGYPGNLKLWVTYTLTDDNTIQLEYRAISDQDTILNLTNHAYWNLNGHETKDAMDHYLEIPSSFFCPTDGDGMTTGEIESVDGTPFDYRVMKQIRPAIEQEFEQLKLGNGFDHCFLLDRQQPMILKGDKSGLCLSVVTDLPAVHLYTANFLTDHLGKNGSPYCRRNAVCLETEQVPDAPNQPHFPSAVLAKDEPFYSCTAYHFYY